MHNAANREQQAKYILKQLCQQIQIPLKLVRTLYHKDREYAIIVPPNRSTASICPILMLIMKVSRSIADLAGTDRIELEHLAEVMHFRGLDKPLETDKKKNGI